VALLSAAVRRLHRAQGSTILLLGEAGIGKTRLAQVAAEAAERAGARAVVGRTLPEVAPSPLWPVGEALLDLTRAQPVPDRSDAFAPYVPVLATLVPQWRQPGWRSPEESLLVMAEAILNALVRFAPAQGLLVILEDLHWADDATLAVVRFVADRVARLPISILVTARTGDGRADLAALLTPTGAHVCELGRLTPAETAEMAAACLGGHAGDAAQQIAKQAAGLPLLVEDLLAAGEHGGLPERFADTVRARLERLDPTHRAILAAAAVLGLRFDWHLLPVIVATTADVVAAALHRAVAAQLLVPDGLGFAFRHALTREVVLAETSAVDRQKLCLAAAEALQASAAGDDLDRERLIGHLLAQGGEARRAADVLLGAGRRALARGLVRAAEPALSAAAALADEVQPLGAVARYELARARLLAGDPRAAIEVAARAAAIADASDPELAARVRLLLARAAIATADWRAATGYVDRARRTCPEDAAVAAEAAVLAAHVALGTTRPEVAVEAEHAAARAVGLAREAGRADLECEALEVLGLCARMRNLDDANAALERALRRAREAGLPAQWLHTLNELGSVELLRDARGDRLEEARQEALRVGALGLATSIELNLAAVHVMTGRFTQGIAMAQRVEASAARLGLRPLQAAAELIQGFAMAHQGKGREMEDHLRTAESLAPEDGELRSGAWAIGRALFALVQEDRTEARRALAQARLAAPGDHVRMLNPYAGPELLLRAVGGEVGVREAHAAVDGAVRSARWPELWTHAALAVALGREGRQLEAGGALAAGMAAGAPYPVFLALAQRLVAESALGHRWCDPEPLLRSAEATFESLGLGRAANACRRMLTTLGSRAPRRRKHDGPLHPTLMHAGITVREAEIMDLLVERLSNREIAERLYLSPRTVEKHVASLLDKLGVERAAIAHIARTLR